MADLPPYKAITAPTFESALRAKARDVFSMLDKLKAQASPVTFAVNDVPVAMSWGTRDVSLNIANGAYNIVMPLAWITSA